MFFFFIFGFNIFYLFHNFLDDRRRKREEEKKTHFIEEPADIYFVPNVLTHKNLSKLKIELNATGFWVKKVEEVCGFAVILGQAVGCFNLYRIHATSQVILNNPLKSHKDFHSIRVILVFIAFFFFGRCASFVAPNNIFFHILHRNIAVVLCY